MSVLDPRLLLLDGDDNVLVLGTPVASGDVLLIDGVCVRTDAPIGRGHKVARRPIALNEQIIKYGAPIGRATAVIARGEHVHVHNIRSDYTPTYVIG